MKKFSCVLFFLSIVFVAVSQNLQVEGTSPNLYITHTVAPKENFYSVGRLYNQLPKVIAAFNNLAMEKGLTIGQQVKVPLTTQNFDNNGNENSGATLIPVTHIIAKSETLFKIGNDFNVTPQLLQKWNGLNSNNITPGNALVVGHLMVVNQGANTIARRPAAAPVEENREVNVASNNAATKPGRQEITEPIRKERVEPKKTGNGVVKEELFESVTPTNTPKKETVTLEVPKSEQAVQPVRDEKLFENTEKPARTEAEAGLNNGSALARNEVSKTGDNRTTERNISNNKTSIEGAFAGNFPLEASQKSLNSKSGDAATFKSVSGWQDKKYYVLMNDVVPGTILKISSAENKIVYAKVLGSMPDMKENTGLLLRISNAAASYLGIIDPKFPVKVTYYQ